ncbi:Protein Mom [Brevibacillus sp. IT-7CA2]|uniref:Mom family adenine methylcarbamoylation protein n=1 Tax=Brevibacillus sp. IT-7CA2 TaxID=3026436 RepID=UPI0039DF9B21
MTQLKVAWATYEAAKFACENFHYSKSLPAGKLVKIGAWEDGKFIGVVIFSRGANSRIGSPYGLTQKECCELTRVALTSHKSFVSEILAKAIKFLKEQSPNVQLIVSYADVEQNHHGGIYQATNWIYEGKTEGERYFIIHGKKTHGKSIHSRYGKGSQRLDWIRKNIDSHAENYTTQGKHKYLMPLNKKIRRKIMPLHKPYPK